jgi:hypothetical protein
MNEHKIIAIYVGVNGIRTEDIESYITELSKKITPTTIQGEIIFLPISSNDIRIECINPVYITDKNLIKKHTTLMNELHQELQHQINQIKKDNYE